METITENKYTFKGNLNPITYYEIFGLPRNEVISNFFIVFIILVMALGLLFSGDISSESSIRFYIMGLLFFLLIIKQRKMWKRNAGMSMIFHNEIYGSYNEKIIHWNSGNYVKVNIPWEAIHNYIIRKKGIALYYSFNQKILLHQSFFKDKDDWDEIKRVVKRKIPRFRLFKA